VQVQALGARSERTGDFGLSWICAIQWRFLNLDLWTQSSGGFYHDCPGS
jgi:hypothetical protein